MFFNCASQKEQYSISRVITLDFNEIEKVYCQSWIAGVEGGGSGINLFIAKNILTSPIEVYFRGQIAKLELKGGYYIGRFKTEVNQEKDYVMDGNHVKEYENELPTKMAFPFKLGDKDAVILVLNKEKREYVKLKNISQRPMIAYPSIKK